MIVPRKKVVFLSLLLSGVVMGITAVVLLYFLNWNTIVESFLTHEGSLGVILVIALRIIFVAGMAFYTFYKWFKQEEQYISDLTFLFGLFFLFLGFGKALDLFNDFIYFHLNEFIVLLGLKTRFFILILDLLPMIYLSSEMILFSFSLKPRFKRLRNEKARNEVSSWMIIIIITIESIAGILVQDSRTLSFFYPLVGIPSLITIVWLFNFARKNKRLSQVNTSILTIGFAMYLFSQIMRPLVQLMIGESAIFVIIAETVDLIIFIVIFIGFYRESNY